MTPVRRRVGAPDAVRRIPRDQAARICLRPGAGRKVEYSGSGLPRLTSLPGSHFKALDQAAHRQLVGANSARVDAPRLWEPRRRGSPAAEEARLAGSGPWIESRYHGHARAGSHHVAGVASSSPVSVPVAPVEPDEAVVGLFIQGYAQLAGGRHPGRAASRSVSAQPSMSR
jgi:hypothetical protein